MGVERERAHLRQAGPARPTAIRSSCFDEFLPDPDHPARYEQIAEMDRASTARTTRCSRASASARASTIESMGLDVFSLMLYDDPDLVKEIHRRFSEWSARVRASI